MRDEFSEKRSRETAKHRRCIVFSSCSVFVSEQYIIRKIILHRITLGGGELCLDAFKVVKITNWPNFSPGGRTIFGQTGRKIRRGVGNTGGREGKRNRQASLTGREN